MGPPEQTWKPTNVRLGVLGFICTLSLITYLDRICIMRAKDDMQKDLGFSNPQMGLIFSAFVLGYAIFEIPGGWMGDRWGSRRVITRIVLCWSLFTALTGCVWRFALDLGTWSAAGLTMALVFDSFVLMVLIRFLFGIGEAGAYPNLTRVTRDWFPFRERAAALGWVWMSARIGGAIAPFVIGRLSVAIGWRGAFWVLGLIGIGWAVLFLYWFRDRPEEHPGCNEAERDLIRAGQPAPTGDGHSWPGVRVLAASVTVWAMCSAAFWVCLGWYFFPTWQPQYLKDIHDFEYDSAASEILTGLPFLCGAIGSLAGGRLSDRMVQWTGSRRWGRSGVGVIGFTGAGLCVLATGWATSAWMAVTLLCLAFLINDLAIPCIWAACADIGGRYAGTVSGLMNTVGAFGAMITPALIPNVLEAMLENYGSVMGWRVIFAGMAGAWFCAALSWVFIDASRPLREDG